MKGRGAGTSPVAPGYGLADLRLKLRFTLVGAGFLLPSGVLSTPNSDFLQSPLQVVDELALAHGLEQQGCGGCGDVERAHLAELWQGDKTVAG